MTGDQAIAVAGLAVLGLLPTMLRFLLWWRSGRQPGWRPVLLDEAEDARRQHQR